MRASSRLQWTTSFLPRKKTVPQCHSDEPQAKNLLFVSVEKTDASLALSMTSG
jgi:hypothetical protein